MDKSVDRVEATCYCFFVIKSDTGLVHLSQPVFARFAMQLVALVFPY